MIECVALVLFVDLPVACNHNRPLVYVYALTSCIDVCRVYEICAAPLVESVLEGYNGTIFAYGQVCGQ